MSTTSVGSTTLLRDQTGAVLIVTALLLMLVMIFLAFQFDIGRLGISQVEHKRAASIGSLAAIEAYWLSTMEIDGGAIRSRHQKGIEEAKTAAARLLGVPANSPLFIDGEQREPDIVVSNDDYPAVSDATRGILRYGHWHFTEPNDGCSGKTERECPCVQGKWRGPCFEPMTESKTVRELATAIQLEYFTAKDSPMRYLFAGIFGQHGSSIRARATSSLLSDAGVLSSPRIVESSIIPVSGSPAGRSPSFVLYEMLETINLQKKAQAKRLPKPGLCKPGIRQWPKSGYFKFSTPTHCPSVSIWVWGAGGSASSLPGEGVGNGGAGGFSFGVLSQQGSTWLDITVGSGGKNPCTSSLTGKSIGGGGSSNASMGEGGGYSAVIRGADILLMAGGGGAAGFGKGSEHCPGPPHGGAGGGLVGESGVLTDCSVKPAAGGDTHRAGLGVNGDLNLRGTRLIGGAGGGGGGYFGGGGSSIDYGGAAGGSGYINQLVSQAATTNGSGRLAAHNQVSQYRKPAGEGGVAKDQCRSEKASGRDGLVTIAWGP